MKYIYLPAVLLTLATFGCRPVNPTSKTVRNNLLPTELIRCAPAVTDRDWFTADQKAPLFDSLGDWTFPVTTKLPLVQRYCDQGLTLAYGFNHAEAARSYHYATRLDPECAMAFWGYAYVLGPNYNAGMEADNYERAYAAVQTARRLVGKKGTPEEKALIEALSVRYLPDAPEDRSRLDSAYALAMGKVYRRFPNHADIGALYVEALMDLHPWDLYDDTGAPRPWTGEIVGELEKLMERFPEHPGANHLYIHAVEASREPGRGLRSAGVFGAGAVPGAGHLVHMPSHIYIRTGDYHLGSLANIRAVEVDSNYVTSCRAQGAYPLAYHPHNYHFLAATATLEGKMSWAVDAARRIARHSDNALMREPGWGLLQHFFTIRDHIDVKFGRWTAILDRIPVEENLLYPGLIRRYARGMAYLGTGRPGRAEKELREIRKGKSNEDLDEIVIGVNAVRPLVEIAELVLAGEIAAHRGDYETAIAKLRRAVEIEDELNYIEPPDWFFSVRHHLGAVLLDAKRYGDAIRTYEEDLRVYPRNGWALSGLAQAYRANGEASRAAATEVRRAEAWAFAEVELRGSRVKLP